MSSRAKRKSQGKSTPKAKTEPLQVTVRAATVRTELSPYNRDFVEALPPTVLNAQTARREVGVARIGAASPIKSRTNQQPSGKQDQANGVLVFAGQKRPISTVIAAPRRGFHGWLIGMVVAVALALISAGAWLVNSDRMVVEGSRTWSAELAAKSQMALDNTARKIRGLVGSPALDRRAESRVDAGKSMTGGPRATSPKVGTPRLKAVESRNHSAPAKKVTLAKGQDLKHKKKAGR
jgi:hypothetical protein